MRILIINPVFYPEPEARGLDFALALKQKGAEVQVLTGFPTYPYGKVYDGYKQALSKKEIISGIEVIRVWKYPDQSMNPIKRILNYCTFAICMTLFGLPRIKKPDIVFAYHGAITIGIPAMAYKLFRRVPFVYDINDLWPDTLDATGMMRNKFLLGIVNIWCRITYRSARHITVLSKGFKETLVRRGVPSGKIDVVYHWSRDTFTNRKLQLPGVFEPEYLNILYAGNLGSAQALSSVIKAMSLLRDKNIRLFLLGDGVEKDKLKQDTQKLHLDNVIFLPRVDQSDVGPYLNAADVLFVHLRDQPLFKITVPSKLISYMSFGKPILAAIHGDAAEIVRESQSGIVCTPEDPEDIARAFSEISERTKEERASYGKASKVYYQKYFTIEANTEKYIQIFEQILKNGR